jgi:hypothetical protein
VINRIIPEQTEKKLGHEKNFPGGYKSKSKTQQFYPSRSGGHWPILVSPPQPYRYPFLCVSVLDEYSNKIRSERHLTEAKRKGNKNKMNPSQKEIKEQFCLFVCFLSKKLTIEMEKKKKKKDANDRD